MAEAAGVYVVVRLVVAEDPTLLLAAGDSRVLKPPICASSASENREKCQIDQQMQSSYMIKISKKCPAPYNWKTVGLNRSGILSVV